jgi:phage terminase large subunit-like protein
MPTGGVKTSRSLSRDTSVDMARKRPFTVQHFKEWAKGLILDNGEPWAVEDFQAAFVRDLFRGYAENWLIIPEGNAKTTFAGGFALYHAEFTPRARVPVAASSRDQAEWLYQAAAGFVERSELKGWRCQEGYRRIRFDEQGSRIQIFAADDRTGDGIVPTLAMLEELHRHRDMSLYRTWRGKLEKRGGQLMAISTAGEPGGEFEETRAKIKEGASEITVRKAFTRAVSGSAVLHEYAVPEDGDPDIMKDVKTANPLKAINIATLQRKFDSPAMTPGHWRRFVCGLPNKLESWLDSRMWDALRADVGNLQDGDEVYVAIRAGAGIGIGIVSPRGNERVAVDIEVIPPPPNGRAALKDAEFALRRICDRYKVRGIAYDYDQFGRSAELLAEAGLPMNKVPQSPKLLAIATTTIWRLISGGLLQHDGNSRLRSQVLSGETKDTTSGWRLSPTAETAGLVALAVAVYEAGQGAARRYVVVL